jgi:hypothetical protein
LVISSAGVSGGLFDYTQLLQVWECEVYIVLPYGSLSWILHLRAST